MRAIRDWLVRPRPEGLDPSPQGQAFARGGRERRLLHGLVGSCVGLGVPGPVVGEGVFVARPPPPPGVFIVISVPGVVLGVSLAVGVCKAVAVPLPPPPPGVFVGVWLAPGVAGSGFALEGKPPSAATVRSSQHASGPCFFRRPARPAVKRFGLKSSYSRTWVPSFGSISRWKRV